LSNRLCDLLCSEAFFFVKKGMDEAKTFWFVIAKDTETSALLPGSRVKPLAHRVKVIKALFYATQVFYSFFIM
jgi:hypothetical protein